MSRRDDEPTLKLAHARPKEANVRTHVELKLENGERTALRRLTAEEREVVVDEMLEQVREDLAWMMALELVRETPAQAVPPPARRSPLRKIG
jgi:hypothetical protein